MNLTSLASGSYTHPDDPGEPSTGKPRVSITDMEASILTAFVAGRDVLEIGTGLGVSTRALAASAASVSTVDIDEWVQVNIWPTLPGNVTGVRSLPRGPFGAVFIDGDHSTEAVARDLRTALSVAGPGAVVLAHDTAYPSVRQGLSEVHPDGWAFIHTTHGIGVLWT